MTLTPLLHSFIQLLFATLSPINLSLCYQSKYISPENLLIFLRSVFYTNQPVVELVQRFLDDDDDDYLDVIPVSCYVG